MMGSERSGSSRARRPHRHHRRHRHRAKGSHTVLWLIVIVLIVFGGGWMLLRGAGDGPSSPVPTTATAPPTLVQRLTIPEGLRREEIAALVGRETTFSRDRYLRLTGPGARGRALAGTGRPTSLEGFLFPATYDIYSDTTVADLVTMQLDAFADNTAGIDLSRARRKNLTPYDVLIIASMIEREVAVPAERRLVASVIYNRLKAGMSLGIDATVQYAIGSWKPDLTVSELNIDSPYNTRRFTGLPPGPISNPGRASIEAAADPADTGYLYYVARNDGSGRHYFARDAAQFERDVQRARANGGR